MALQTLQCSLPTHQLIVDYGEMGRAAPQSIPILWVHGLGSQWRQFEQQLLYFGTAYHSVAPSLRGHGTTVQHPSDQPITLSALAEDLLAFLDALALPKVHYVGNSMGGNLGFELLQRAPERLVSLTTFGTTAHLHQPAWLVRCLQGVYRWLSPSLIARLSSTAGQTAAAKAHIRALFQSVNRDTVRQLLPELAQLDYLAVLSDSEVPWLLVQGTADRDINRVLQETLTVHQRQSHNQLVQLDGAGHFANLDQSEAFHQALTTFWAKLP